MTNAATERLLAPINNPVLTQSLRNALLSHEKIIVSRLPPPLFVPVFLLSTLAREWKEEEIVDDYHELCQVLKDNFNATVPQGWHPSGNIASSILFLNAEIGSYNQLHINGFTEVEYIAAAYRDLTGVFLDVEQPSPFLKRSKKKGGV